MEWRTTPSLTCEAWLGKLERRLVWYFPAAQAKDILSDYQEQFDAGRDHCKTEIEIIQALGTPEEAAALLLEEDPSARTDCLKHSALWGTALAVCLAFLWACINSFSYGLFLIGTLFCLPLMASALFLLLHGAARVELEKPAKKLTSSVSVYYVPFSITVLFEIVEQILLALAQGGYLPDHLGGMHIGVANTWLILSVEIIAILLAAWLVHKSVTVSIQYFPGIIHTIGTGITAYFTYAFLTGFHLDQTYPPTLNLLMCLLPYCAGLSTALVFQRWTDGRKPLPRFFREREATWQDWHHQLGVRLLGWFSVEQTMEVLEDYQEQYELGLEQGKSEGDLLCGMGRPETVVRDLLAEDRKARLHRRKQRPWIIAAAAAAWLLLTLVRGFELGFVWMYSDRACKAGVIALLLGTVSLFMLLHGRERAAVEQRFPAPQKPSIWLWVVPLACSALTEGLSLGCIYSAPVEWEPVFLGQSLAWYVITTTQFSVLILTVLLLWTLVRCFSGSIRYFPAAPFITGSFAHVLCVGLYLHSMDVEFIWQDLEGSIWEFLPSLCPWAAGLLLAIVSWLVLRKAAKKEG